MKTTDAPQDAAIASAAPVSPVVPPTLDPSTDWTDLDDLSRQMPEDPDPVSANTAARTAQPVSDSRRARPARSGLPGWAIPAAIFALVLAVVAWWFMPAGPTAQPTAAAPVLPALPDVAAAPAKALPGEPMAAEPVEPPPPARPDELDQAMLERLDRMEARLDAVIAGLREKGYLIKDAQPGDDGVLPVEAFVPHPGVAPVRAPVARRTVAAASAPKATDSAAEPPRQVSTKLLSVDLWNGQPSVVVSTGLPGADAVRVLQPGDVYNGVTLKAVDMAAGRATFAIGNRETTLLVASN